MVKGQAVNKNILGYCGINRNNSGKGLIMKKTAKKTRKTNDKGFTLVELLVAIILLGIIALPIFSSMITSARLNKRSREIAYATDVAESIMEGFVDKTYRQIDMKINDLGSSTASGNCFSNINNGVYNDGANVLKYIGTDSVSLNTIHDKVDVSIDCVDISNAAGTANMVLNQMNSFEGAYADDALSFIRGCFVTDVAPQFDDTSQKLVVWQNESGVMSVFGYSNIEYNGMVFDAVVVFVPEAYDDDDLYFTYHVSIYLYEVEAGSHDKFANDDYLVYFNSGIKSR